MALTVTSSDGKRLSFRTDVIGDNTLLAAQGVGRRIVVRSATIIGVGGDVSVYFKTGSTSHLGGSDLKSTLNAEGPAGGLVLQRNEDGWFAGGDNESLVLNLSAAAGVMGFITYDVRS